MHWIKAVGNTLLPGRSEVKTLARQVVRSRKAVARLERSRCEIGEHTAMMLESLESKHMIQVTHAVSLVDKIVAYSTWFHQVLPAMWTWGDRIKLIMQAVFRAWLQLMDSHDLSVSNWWSDLMFDWSCVKSRARGSHVWTHVQSFGLWTSGAWAWTLFNMMQSPSLLNLFKLVRWARRIVSFRFFPLSNSTCMP